MKTHSLERTNPKGQPFIGTCRLCGAPNLPMSAAREYCENIRGLSSDEALLEALHPRTSQDKGEPNNG